MLADIPYLDLSYEKNIENEKDQLKTISRICDFLNIPYTTPTCEFRKISPSSLKDSIENYGEVADFLHGTRYQKFLS
jgi:hypothetical protein